MNNMIESATPLQKTTLSCYCTHWRLLYSTSAINLLIHLFIIIIGRSLFNRLLLLLLLLWRPCSISIEHPRKR